MKNDGRRRQHRGSSDGEGVITWENFINEDFWVGGSTICSVPVDTMLITTEHRLYPRLTQSYPEWNRFTPCESSHLSNHD